LYRSLSPKWHFTKNAAHTGSKARYLPHHHFRRAALEPASTGSVIISARRHAGLFIIDKLTEISA
jgi:hypothetical protein